MSVAESQAAVPKPSFRWLCPTPGRCLAALLLVEALLWLSERLGWPAWHKGYAVLIAVAGVGGAMLVMFLWLFVTLVFRLRFQFTTRSLLVLTAAVALLCGWIMSEIRRAIAQRDLVVAFSAAGGGGCYDDAVLRPTWSIRGRFAHRPLPGWSSRFTPSGALELWLQRQFGYDFFHYIDEARVDSDFEIKLLKGFTCLEFLRCDGPSVTDAGLEVLAGLTRLEALSLNDTRVSHDAVQKLQQALPNCKIEWSPPTTPGR